MKSDVSESNCVCAVYVIFSSLLASMEDLRSKGSIGIGVTLC